MTVGEVLGWINTRLILGVLFYSLFTPLGLLMRLRGKEPHAGVPWTQKQMRTVLYVNLVPLPTCGIIFNGKDMGLWVNFSVSYGLS
jgi:Saxitoxin biosynthesis operon protein SxtJ